MMLALNFITTVLGVLLLQSIISLNEPTQVEAASSHNTFNHTGCLYAHLDDASKYEVMIPDRTDHLTGTLGNMTLDPKSACIQKSTPGSLVIDFDINDNNFHTMTLEMKLQQKDKEYNWEISAATLTIQPVNGEMFNNKQFQLVSASGDIYAGLKQSYSCSSLVLQHREANGVHFKITLRRFQVQPFQELNSYVFAPSRDCSSWLTLPQIMGFLLMLFIIFTVLIGVYLLLELGGHSSDLRFSKQGGMLMNQAQLDATKAD